MLKRHLLVFVVSIITLLNFLPTPSLAGSWNGWIYQNPYPTANTLLAVKFVTPQKGWIAGEKGIILYTEDGGDTWEAQGSGTEQDIKSIAFVNEKQGWAVGNGGLIIHTEDGGKTWVSQGETKKASLNKVFFINDKEGWAVGTEWTESGDGLVLHTTDGGKKWERQDAGIRRAIASIYFINHQTGWILAGDEIYRTVDGGKNWEKSKLPIKLERSGKVGRDIIISPIGEDIPPDWWQGDITFVNEKEGWLVLGLWFIFHTEDGGKTWVNQLTTGYMSYGLNTISFIDGQRGCASGSSILCTADGGKIWVEKLNIKPGQREDINGFPIGLAGISFIGTSEGWTVGVEGQIMKTEDGGKSWRMEARRSECGGNIFFVNEKTGWIYGQGDKHSFRTHICYTEDGGYNLAKQEVGINVWDIFFVNSSTGWAVGTIGERKAGKLDKVWGVIRNTTDGGKTWSTQFKELMGKSWVGTGLVGVFFVNSDIGWVVGKKGFILHTKDGGKHWERQKSGDTELQIEKIQFIDSKIGWMVGIGGTEGWIGVIFHTEDGGQHWKIQYKKEDIGLDGVFFIDKKSGWVTGETEYAEDCWLFHTEDGGKTWSEREIGKNVGYCYPAFLDKYQGVISTEKGLLFITKDAGKTWTTMRKPISKYPWHYSEIFEKEK